MKKIIEMPTSNNKKQFSRKLWTLIWMSNKHRLILIECKVEDIISYEIFQYFSHKLSCFNVMSLIFYFPGRG